MPLVRVYYEYENTGAATRWKEESPNLGKFVVSLSSRAARLFYSRIQINRVTDQSRYLKYVRTSLKKIQQADVLPLRRQSSELEKVDLPQL